MPEYSLSYVCGNLCSYIIFTSTDLSFRSLLVSAIAFMPILGSTWIIGVFAVNEHTEFFAWIFTILNSLQVCMLMS